MKFILLYLFSILLVLAACNENGPMATKEKQKVASSIKDSGIQQLNRIENATIKSILDVVPTGYFILDSASSMNKKGVTITVLVLAAEKEKTEEFTDEKRVITILHKEQGIWRRLASNSELVLCRNCGGVFGDPYAGITLKDTILTIDNYGGSAWRWSQRHIFRYQQNEWQLIGATYDAYYNAKDCPEGAGLAGRQLEDINFAAAKMHIIHTNDDDCIPFEDYKKSFKKKAFISFSDFPGKPSQWPSGHIMDGDGKE